MSILLLAECWPYRNVKAGSFDNSQGRLLAHSCGISISQLEQLCTCRFVLDRYIPSFKRQRKRYNLELLTAISLIWDDVISHHDLTIFIGKRLIQIVSSHDVGFFVRCYSHWLDNPNAPIITCCCIPNPMASFWWKEETNIAKVKEFMTLMFKLQGK